MLAFRSLCHHFVGKNTPSIAAHSTHCLFNTAWYNLSIYVSAPVKNTKHPVKADTRRKLHVPCCIKCWVKYDDSAKCENTAKYVLWKTAKYECINVMVFQNWLIRCSSATFTLKSITLKTWLNESSTIISLHAIYQIANFSSLPFSIPVSAMLSSRHLHYTRRSSDLFLCKFVCMSTCQCLQIIPHHWDVGVKWNICEF